jgi:hypothetical protein
MARHSGAMCARSGKPFHKRILNSRAARATLSVVAVGHH